MKKVPAQGDVTELNSIIQRKVRSFDVYLGPVLVGTLEEMPGMIVSTSGNKLQHKYVLLRTGTRSFNRFCRYKQYELQSESVLLKTINFSESMNHLLISTKSIE